MPAGTTRRAATRRGRPAGKSSVIVTYVVPHRIGASTVVPAIAAPARRSGSTFIILISR